MRSIDDVFYSLDCLCFAGVAVSPVVTFKPNWRNILSGDTVTVSCNVVSEGQEQMYYWYKDEKPSPIQQQSFTIQSASWRDVGDYRCYTTTSDISHPVKLNVINGEFQFLVTSQHI